MSITVPPTILGPEFRKWLRQFYGRLAFFSSFCWKTPMPIKFLLLGGGGCWVFFEGGGWKCQFYFMGVGIFPIFQHQGNFLGVLRKAAHGPQCSQGIHPTYHKSWCAKCVFGNLCFSMGFLGFRGVKNPWCLGGFPGCSPKHQRKGRWGSLKMSESVKCRFSKCRFSVLNLKFDFISDGGCTREEEIQKALGSLPPCGNRCRFSESAICSSRVHPPSEIKSNLKFKTLRWRLLRWRLTLFENVESKQVFNFSTFF